MITVKRFECRQGGGCCYVLSDETRECVIVDPGFNTPQEKQIVSGYIAENGLKPVKLLCTHWHYDHVMGNRFVTELPGACIIYPGHGEKSTIAQESKTNPFLMI